MTGNGVGWWKGGNVITGLSSGWFNSAGGTMGEAAKAERVDYRNEGTRIRFRVATLWNSPRCPPLCTT